jgi:hypothetical protein
LAVDETTVYWTACGTDPYTHDGLVMKAPKAGGPADALASGQTCPTEIALDSGNVYWLAGAFEEGYQVLRAPKGGGEPVAVGAGRDIRSLAADESGVYWSDCEVSTDDCAILRLAPGATEPQALASALAYPDALTLDATDVYWVNGSTTIMRAPKDGAGAAPAVLASSQFYPQALAVDESKVYWAGLSYVIQVDKASGGRTVLASDQTPADLVVDATHVYWANYDGGVMRVPRGGGPLELVAADGAGGKNLALDADRVYWSNFDLGTLTAVGKSGQPAPPAASPSGTVIAAAQERLTALLADDGGIYWSTCGTEAANYLDGTVAWAPSGGAAPAVLAAAQSCPVVVGADAERVFWYAGRYYDPAAGDLYAVAKAGGEPQLLVAGLTNVSDFAVDDAKVYWSTCGTQEQNFADAAILSVPHTGGEASAIVPDCGLITAAGGSLYWSNAGGIFAVSNAGGEARLLGPGGSDLIVDGASLYFTTFESASQSGLVSCADEASTLMALPLEGGETRSLATLEGASLGLAAGPGVLYWASDCRQGIVRVPLEGGEPVLAVEVIGHIGSLAVNSAGLYWTNAERGTVHFLPQ